TSIASARRIEPPPSSLARVPVRLVMSPDPDVHVEPGFASVAPPPKTSNRKEGQPAGPTAMCNLSVAEPRFDEERPRRRRVLVGRAVVARGPGDGRSRCPR